MGGELTLAGDLIFSPLRETIAQRAVPAAAAAVEVLPSLLGERAELVGAICFALDAVGSSTAHGRLAPGLATSV
jgi:hypothetical protein